MRKSPINLKPKKKYYLRARIVVTSSPNNDSAVAFLLKLAEMIDVEAHQERNVAIPESLEDDNISDVVYFYRKGISLNQKRELFLQLKTACWMIEKTGFYLMALPQQSPYKVKL